MAKKEILIHLPRPHPKQIEFIRSPAKRKIVRAGRRGGKTVGVSIMAVEQFLAGHRVLYAAPTMEQVSRFWVTITRALYEPVKHKLFRQNQTEHFIERPGTEQRIKGKTAWNADSLRGDYADILIMDEWQLMNEGAWDNVGAPMLLDNDGDAIFIYTPPSLRARKSIISKADDPQHAAKLFRRALEFQNGGSTRWAAFHFSSMDNPHLARTALDEIATDMSALSYRMEILAEDVDEAPGALWTRNIIDKYRVIQVPEFDRIVVGVDPSVEAGEAGIVVCANAGSDGYVLADESGQMSPAEWAKVAVVAYHKYHANWIVAERNQGGQMVELTIHQIDPDVPVKLVRASWAKQARAEPVSAKAEKGLIHHVGAFPQLEDELCLWVPGDDSPNRLDAMVWGMTELLLSATDLFDDLDAAIRG